MYRGRAVTLSSISSLLRSNQTLSSLPSRRQPYLLSSLSSHGLRSALFEFPRMEEEARLFLVLNRKMYGIKIRELMRLGKEEKKKEAKDWETLPPAPFDFCAELPDTKDFMRHRFVLDSKLYLAGGGVNAYPDNIKNRSSLKKRKICVMLDTGVEEYEVLDTPWCNIYEFDVNKMNFVPADPNSIPPPPTPFSPCFLGNISGHHDVYCFADNYSTSPELLGLWVLSSSSSTPRMWKHLPNPPTISSRGCVMQRNKRCFVFQGKFFLFIKYTFPREEDVLFSFDPTTAKWMFEDLIPMKNPFRTEEAYLFPFVSLSLNNCKLSYTTKEEEETEPKEEETEDDFYQLPREVSISVTVSTVNKNGAGFCYRLLPECLHGIQPSYSFVYDFKLVDLGNNMVCALLYVYTPYHYVFPVLCMSVFTIKMVEPTIGIVTEAPQEEREDLYIEIHARRAFTIKQNTEESIWSMLPFVYPLLSPR